MKLMEKEKKKESMVTKKKLRLKRIRFRVTNL
jgi:hypothetical protein